MPHESLPEFNYLDYKIAEQSALGSVLFGEALQYINEGAARRITFRDSLLPSLSLRLELEHSSQNWQPALLAPSRVVSSSLALVLRIEVR